MIGPMPTAVLLGLLAVCGIAAAMVAIVRYRLRGLVCAPGIPKDLGTLMLIERYGNETKDLRPRPPHRPNRRRKTTLSSYSGQVSEVSPLQAPRTSDPIHLIEASLQSGYDRMEAFRNLLAIDEHVYTAMGTLAGEQLDSIGDLSRSLESWESAEFGDALPKGAFGKLMGHLAEPKVAQHMEELGIEVTMPDVSNQEGYDLVLNGEHAVNVKTVADTGSLWDHFTKYPDIPVVVPKDAEGIPENAIYINSADSLDRLDTAFEAGQENIVLVDPSLSHADMVEHTENVSDALLGNMELVNIPIVTAVISGMREFRLLKKGSTDVRNALKNFGLDIAGTGGGGAAGTFLGMTVGTAVLPGIGTIIGALLGGAGGIMAGRKITGRFKRRHLNELMVNYEKQVDHFNQTASTLQKKVQRQYKAARCRAARELKRAAETSKHEIEQHHDQLLQKRRGLCRLSVKQCNELVTFALSELQGYQRRLERAVSWAKWMPGFLVGSAYSTAIEQHLNTQHQLIVYEQTRLRREADNLIGGHPHEELAGEKAAQFLQLVLAVEGTTDRIRQILADHEKDRSRHEEKWQQQIRAARESLFEERHRTVERLACKISQIRKKVEHKLRPILAELGSLTEEISAECGRLGMRR